jgi:hypothetical protein
MLEVLFAVFGAFLGGVGICFGAMMLHQAKESERRRMEERAAERFARSEVIVEEKERKDELVEKSRDLDARSDDADLRDAIQLDRFRELRRRNRADE